MKRSLQAMALVGLWMGLVGFEVRGQDTIYYIDPETKKETDIDAPIKEEGPGGITVTQGDGVKLIPALAITQVTYKVDGITAPEFRRPDAALTKALRPDNRAEDRKEGLETALREFEDLGEKVAGLTRPNRYVKYRIAQIKGLLGKEDPAKMEEGIEALNTFQKGFSTGWQIVPCLKQLAELEEGRDNVDGALAAYNVLSIVPDVPPAIQREASFLVAQLLLRRNRSGEAESKLKSIKAKMASKDPQLPMVEVLLTQAQMAQNKLDTVEKQLQAALKATNDNDIRAIAHNVMGDYYMKKDKGEDAFWQYLRVEVMYSQNPKQHAKSLYHLWKLFDKVKGDPQRAEECYIRLMAEGFNGTEFQQKAKAEKKE